MRSPWRVIADRVLAPGWTDFRVRWVMLDPPGEGWQERAGFYGRWTMDPFSWAWPTGHATPWPPMPRLMDLLPTFTAERGAIHFVRPPA